MTYVTEKDGIVDGLLIAENGPRPQGRGIGDHSEISRLMAIMYRASKPHYIIRTIPACNSDD